MSTYKAFLAVVAILAAVSNANAELILTVNGFDAPVNNYRLKGQRVSL